ncbi:helix-turn-helix transcriptional regulator [Luteibacter sp. 621]|uniref:helix-turn-helix transcriptional regulator n=1 Tax=Luteibacter sp. 621 TaxID=3373916 RepID=UPI003D25F97F
MISQAAPALRFERLPVVCDRIGVTKSTLYRWMESGHFPTPIRIGEYAVAWDSRVVDRWMLNLISKAEKDAAAMAWAD